MFKCFRFSIRERNEVWIVHTEVVLSDQVKAMQLVENLDHCEVFAVSVRCWSIRVLAHPNYLFSVDENEACYHDDKLAHPKDNLTCDEHSATLDHASSSSGLGWPLKIDGAQTSASKRNGLIWTMSQSGAIYKLVSFPSPFLGERLLRCR